MFFHTWLEGMECWVTGIRAEQSSDRHDLDKLEWDEQHKIIKFHPLLDWTATDVKNFIKKHNVPYNILHDRGFVSIGCAPCTRAVKEGDDFSKVWLEGNTSIIYKGELNEEAL